MVDLSQTPHGEALGDYVATLKWDATALQWVGYESGDAPFATPEIDTSQVAAGKLQFQDIAAEGAGGVIRLLSVTFRGVGSPGSQAGIELQISAMHAAQSKMNLLPIVTVENFQGVLGDACLLGDVTGDNAVTLRDALVASTYSAKLEVAPEFLTRIKRGCADASRDGLTSVFDALLIAMFESNLSTGPYTVGVADCQSQ